MAGAKEGVVFARNGIENTGFAYAFSLIEGKCKLPVLFCLYLDGTTRYNELKRKLAPATYKSLTSALRGLVADGLVERVEYPPGTAESGVQPDRARHVAHAGA